MPLLSCSKLYKSVFGAVSEEDILSEIFNVFPDIPRAVSVDGQYLIFGISHKQETVKATPPTPRQPRLVDIETQTEGVQISSVAYAHASVTTAPTPSSADVYTQVDLPPPGQYANAQIETDLEEPTDLDSMGSSRSSSVASQTEHNSPSECSRQLHLLVSLICLLVSPALSHPPNLSHNPTTPVSSCTYSGD